jgi:hypothetical protein
MSRSDRVIHARTAVVAFFPLALVLAAVAASGQTPQPQPQPQPQPSQAVPAQRRQAAPAQTSVTRQALKVTPTQAPARPPIRRRSIVHHYPYPYPEYYYSDARAGFRNPGGEGRYAEYYPAGDRFQLDDPSQRDPVRVAKFDQGGGPNWDEQRAAQYLGVAKYNAIQNHIDNYARAGWGWGVGGFGGFY